MYNFESSSLDIFLEAIQLNPPSLLNNAAGQPVLLAKVMDLYGNAGAILFKTNFKGKKSYVRF